MAKKPTYEELEQRIYELKKEVSGLKQTTELLKENEEKCRQFIDSLIDTVYEFDREGKFTYVNKAATLLFGYSREELLNGLRVQDTMVEGGGTISREAIQEVLKGNNSIGERTFIRKDGKQFIGEIHSGPIYKGKDVCGVRGVLRDITASKLAEDTLRESEIKFRSLFDLTPQAIAVTEEETGRLVDVNDTFCAITKYSKEEVLGRTTTELGLYSKEDRNRFINELKPSGEINGLSMDFRAKDGCILNSLMYARHIKLKGKLFIITTFLDETERKRLESQLLHAQKMEAIGALAGGVAHDLNNVLSGIVNYPELLLMDLPEDSWLREPIEAMQKSGHKAVAIVQDLLTVARGIATKKETLNLNTIISDYLNSPEFKKLQQFHPEVKLKTKFDTDLFNMSGSPVHIGKAVMNLVSNASEAITGSGNVTISTMNRYVNSVLTGNDDVVNGEYAVVAVSDDGSGIKPYELKKIFEPFYTKKVLGRSGTGLGLAVVWNVVKDHKGYINVTSDENGTTFELFFPITRNEVTDKNLSFNIKDYKGNGETILVIDDVECQREISCKMLDILGYKAKAVSSGKEAIEYLKENTVDLLLLDMIMDPGINGFETYKRILEINPKQKAVITSGFAETDDVKKTQKLGAGQYIKKPLMLEKLGLSIKEELQKY